MQELRKVETEKENYMYSEKFSRIWTLHSHKILTKQQGWPQGVSSVGNPLQALTGFNSGSLAK